MTGAINTVQPNNYPDRTYIQSEALAPEQIPEEVTVPEGAGEELNKDMCAGSTPCSHGKNLSFRSKIEQKIEKIIPLEQGNEYVSMAISLKKSIESIVDNITEEDVKNVIKENYNPEKVSIEIFSRIVKQNKMAIKMNKPEKIELSLQESLDDFKELTKDPEKLLKISDALQNTGISVNPKNIAKVQSVLKKMDEIKPVGNETLVGILEKEPELTIDEVYKVKYMSSRIQTDEENLSSLTPQIERILSENQMGGAEDIALAKMMIQKNILLNKESLDKVKQIRDAVANLKQDTVIRKAVENIAMNKPAGQIPIEMKLAESEAQKQPILTKESFEAAIHVIPEITQDHIEEVLLDNKGLNLQNLQTVVHEGSDLAKTLSGLEKRVQNLLDNGELTDVLKLSEVKKIIKRIGWLIGKIPASDQNNEALGKLQKNEDEIHKTLQKVESERVKAAPVDAITKETVEEKPSPVNSGANKAVEVVEKTTKEVVPEEPLQEKAIQIKDDSKGIVNEKTAKEETADKESAVKESAIKDNAVKDSTIKESVVKDIASKEILVVESASRDAVNSSVTSDTLVKEPETKEASTKESTPKDSVAKEVATEKNVTKVDSTKEDSTKEKPTAKTQATESSIKEPVTAGPQSADQEVEPLDVTILVRQMKDQLEILHAVISENDNSTESSKNPVQIDSNAKTPIGSEQHSDLKKTGEQESTHDPKVAETSHESHKQTRALHTHEILNRVNRPYEVAGHQQKQQKAVQKTARTETIDVHKNTPQNPESQESYDLKVIRTQLQLEEIRLKMTYDAAKRLSGKGINIETEPIEKVVEGLRTLEREVYEKHLIYQDVEPTGDNVDKVQKTMDMVMTLKQVSPKVVAMVAQEELPFTISDMAVKTSAELISTHAMKQYDEMATKPRSDLGDHVERTFSQIGKILQDIGLPETTYNTRAVKILAKNEMEITPENIEKIKEIDLKVIAITEKLHPGIVVSMIKEQLSPVEMHVDDVLDFVADFMKHMGESDEDQIAKSILQMDRQKNITKEERDGLVGIYRLFSTISKSKGQAVGFLVKNNMELTMNNLFEAAKFIQKSKGNRPVISGDVDENFGILKQLNRQGKAIKDQIRDVIQSEGQSAIQEPHTDDLETKKQVKELILNSFIEKMSPKVMLELERSGLLQNPDLPLEKMIEQIESLDIPEVESPEQSRELIKVLKELSGTSPKTLENIGRFALQNDLYTIKTVKDMWENPFEFQKKLNRMLDKLDQEVPTHRLKEILSGDLQDKMSREDYSEHLQRTKDEINKLKDEIMIQQLTGKEVLTKDLSETTKIIEYQQAMLREEDYYQIPIMVNGRLTQLNMYYLNNQKDPNGQEESEDMRIYIYFNTENLGKVQAYIHLKDKNMDFGIYTENPSDLDTVKENEESFRKILSKTAYQLTGFQVGYFPAESPIAEQIPQNASSVKRHNDSQFEGLI